MIPLEDLLTRLERERLEADRLYNQALTAVDHSIQDVPALPPPPGRYDDERITPINQAWNILPAGAPAIDRSLKGRLRGFIWRLIGPPLEAQRRFNAELVDHVNRNVAAHQETQQATARLIEVVKGELEKLARFESLLVQFLQTITLYVDSKDRSVAGTELRERLALAEQRILALKREVESLAGSGARRPADTSHAGSAAAVAPEPERRSSGEAFASTLDSQTYAEFEDRFRGPTSEISDRLQAYLPIFAGASNVLDVGCGRGELLDLLRSANVSARGIDVNDAMVERCRARGLEVERADALGYLERQGDGSLGGLVAIQVVEHFDPPYLLRFLEAAHHKLRPGAPLVLETLNPACWMAFFECYIRDITHRWPLHPDTLRYLVQAAGFTSVDVQFREPVGAADRLQHAKGEAAWLDVISVVNANVDKLNARLFSAMDYAVIARRV